MGNGNLRNSQIQIAFTFYQFENISSKSLEKSNKLSYGIFYKLSVKIYRKLLKILNANYILN